MIITWHIDDIRSKNRILENIAFIQIDLCIKKI